MFLEDGCKDIFMSINTSSRCLVSWESEVKLIYLCHSCQVFQVILTKHWTHNNADGWHSRGDRLLQHSPHPRVVSVCHSLCGMQLVVLIDVSPTVTAPVSHSNTRLCCRVTGACVL